MDFNCQSRLQPPLRRQFTFYHSVPRNFWLIAFAVELFGYLLYYLSFVLTSIENQQYFNFKKQTEAILVRFSKHNFDKCIAPKTIIMFKLVRGLIAQDTNHYILKFFEGIYILYIYIYIAYLVLIT